MAKRASEKAKSAGSTLAAADAIATIGVRDLKAARKFYEGALGLEPRDERDAGVVSYSSGDSQLLVYESKHAGTNQATAVTWVIENVEGVVAELEKRGVAFEHYDTPGMTFKGDVHVRNGTRAAWFRDPDGNILAIVSP